MNLVRSLVSSKRASGGGVRDLKISRPQSIGDQPHIDGSLPSGRKSFAQPQSPHQGQGHYEYSGRQPQRQSHGQVPAYLAQQSAHYCPTPQLNTYGSFSSPGFGGPISPGSSHTPVTPGFGSVQPASVDYPTPGATPTSTPRYVLPSFVASQMEGESMPTFARQSQHQPLTQQQPIQQLQQPPQQPPQVVVPQNAQQGFALSDKEWQEALQAQQEHEWQMHMQQQIVAVQEQQRQEQQAQAAARKSLGLRDEEEDGEAKNFDAESFYDIFDGRRNTHTSSLASGSPQANGPSSYRDSAMQRQSQRTTNLTSQKRLSPEEEFYSSVNLGRASKQSAQFTANSNAPDSAIAAEPGAPRTFSIDLLSTNSYPVPTPMSASRRPKEPTSVSVITNHFPNWFIDGSTLPDGEADDGIHGPLAKRRRTTGNIQAEGDEFWGVLYDSNGKWSPMWHRLLDGIFDYYHRINCSGKQGLDPRTLKQMWEDLGYSVEDNLYESQIRLAQSLFHPDPEDFISSLLTNYFSLLDLPHVLEQPPVQPPPSYLPKCVNPAPPVSIPILTRDGFKRYFTHQTLLDPSIMHERFNRLLKNKPTGIVDPETSLPFVRREAAGHLIPRQSFPQRSDPVTEEVEEKVRGWMRIWVKREVEGWVGGGGGIAQGQIPASMPMQGMV